MTYNQSVLEHVDNGTDGSLFLTCIGTCKLFRLLKNYKLPADFYTTDRMYAWLYQSVTNQSVLEHVDNGDGLILPNAGNTQLCFICKLRYQPFVVRALLLYMWRVLTKSLYGPCIPKGQRKSRYQNNPTNYEGKCETGKQIYISVCT